MNNTAIQASRLSKVYRLYNKPHHRFLDMFGLLRKNSDAYTEYPALNGIDLRIQRGEKVAIIGRNGAGKSTFLKIVSRITEPSNGSIQVNGHVHALLSIGAGFHPDFTGRENAYSYLEHMGVSGMDADRKVDEIIQFAEIEEYIDQPIKTYSTGMGARLMFSASTAIAPDILIIDEVLGVGDAYFTKKSFDRMRDLCDGEGTTLLLVTHDIYAASAFCDRMIWIDRGRIVQDDICETVVKAYEASIRLQEEERLRQRTLSYARKYVKDSGSNPKSVFCQLVTENRVPLEQSMAVRAIRILANDQVIDEISMKSGKSKKAIPETRLILNEGEGNWGEAYERNGTWYRDFQPFGSIFQRAPFVFNLSPDNSICRGEMALELETAESTEQSVYVEMYRPTGQTICKRIEFGQDREKVCVRLALPPDFIRDDCISKPKVFGLESQEDIAESGRHIGNKRLKIDNVTLEDGEGCERLLYEPLENMTIAIRIRLLDPTYSGHPTMLAAIHKEGLKPTTRMITQNLDVQNDSITVERRVSIKLKPILLGPGVYSLTIGLYENNYFEESDWKHYAANQMVMDVVRNAAHFEIKSDKMDYYRLDYVQPAEWTIEEEISTTVRQDD